jgi:rare lipoprotein A
MNCPSLKGFKLVFPKIICNFVSSPIDEHMRFKKLHYVFSFIFILFIGLSEPGFAQTKGKITKGLATWYGNYYHGKKTTSGEVYNKNSMTAAHLTLPFGTKVKVTNPNTKKSVIVRINDRGPFGNKQRIIDLSEAAARKLNIYGAGEAPVTVEVLSASVLMEEDKNNLLSQVPATAPETASLATNIPYFIIQAGAFSEHANAMFHSEKIKSLDQHLAIQLKEEFVNGQRIHRVMAGQFASRAEAEAFKSKLGQKGINGLIKQMPGAS